MMNFKKSLAQRDPDQYEEALQEQRMIQDETIPTNPQQSNITLENITDPLRETIFKPPSIRIPTCSILFHIPVKLTTENKNKNLYQDDRSTLSTLNTNTTQPIPRKQTLTRNFDPAPLPSLFSTHTTLLDTILPNKILRLHL